MEIQIICLAFTIHLEQSWWYTNTHRNFYPEYIQILQNGFYQLFKPGTFDY